MSTFTEPWPRPRPPVYDLSEAWAALEGARLAGWFIATHTSIDHGWEWTATRPTGRRFGETARAVGRDPVEAITDLVRQCEEIDERDGGRGA